MQSIRKAFATAGVCAVALAGVLVPLPAAAAPPSGPLPTVSPTPQSIERAGDDLNVPGRVEVVVDAGTDAAALAELRATLDEHGVDRVDERATASGTAPLTIRLGAASRADRDASRATSSDARNPRTRSGHRRSTVPRLPTACH